MAGNAKSERFVIAGLPLGLVMGAMDNTIVAASPYLVSSKDHCSKASWRPLSPA